MTGSQGPWLSVGENSQHPRVSSDTVYRWINPSAMPTHKVRRNWRPERAKLGAWAKKYCATCRVQNEGKTK